MLRFLQSASTLASLLAALPATAHVSFAPQARVAATDAVSAILAINVDADQDVDLVITELVDDGDGRAVILLNNGAGVFTRGLATTLGLRPFAMAAGDFNADGETDVAVAVLGDDEVAVLLGTGLGAFAPPLTFTVGDTPNAIAVGDVNGDGDLDILVANEEADALSVLLGDGLGGFAAFQTVDASVPAQRTRPKGLAVGDFNDDGDLDAAVTLFDRDSVGLLLGNGDGTFDPMTLITVGSDPIGIVAVDLDASGTLDLAVGNSTGDSISVLYGAGDGTFTARGPFSAGNAPSAIAAADADHDGRLDLITTNREADTVGVLLGGADGDFGTPASAAVDGAPVGLAVADFNGDDLPDIATANLEDENVSVLLATEDEDDDGSADGDDLGDLGLPECGAGAACGPTSFASLAMMLAGLMGMRRVRPRCR